MAFKARGTGFDGASRGMCLLRGLVGKMPQGFSCTKGKGWGGSANGSSHLESGNCSELTQNSFLGGARAFLPHHLRLSLAVGKVVPDPCTGTPFSKHALNRRDCFITFCFPKYSKFGFKTERMLVFRKILISVLVISETVFLMEAIVVWKPKQTQIKIPRVVDNKFPRLSCRFYELVWWYFIKITYIDENYQIHHLCTCKDLQCDYYFNSIIKNYLSKYAELLIRRI